MESFESVEAFLRAARSAKHERESQVTERIAPFLEDKSSIGVNPEVLEMIDRLVDEYGDEAMRSIGMFCIGKWMRLHQEIMEKHIKKSDTKGMLFVMNDISKLSTVLHILESIPSFGGDEEWRNMLKKEVSRALVETLEEKGMDVDQWLSDHKDS